MKVANVLQTWDQIVPDLDGIERIALSCHSEYNDKRNHESTRNFVVRRDRM